jgi:hypothetical protein
MRMHPQEPFRGVCRIDEHTPRRAVQQLRQIEHPAVHMCERRVTLQDRADPPLDGLRRIPHA